LTECQDCDLYLTCIHPNIPVEGDSETAEVLICGEGPGSDEDIAQRPFVGDCGRLLRKAIKLNKIINICIVNTVRCRPPNNADPTIKQIRACFPKTLELIKNMPNLKLIVPVGNVSLRAFTGKQGITKASGTEIEWNNMKMMPLLHPAAILYDHRYLKVFNDHVARIPNILNKSATIDNDRGLYTRINTLDDWKELYRHILRKRYFTYDLETTGLNPFQEDQRIKLITFSIEPRTATVLSIDQWWDTEDWTYIYRDLTQIFEDKTIGKIGTNIKYDNLWMKVILDIDVKGTIGDIALSQYTIFPHVSNDLKSMAWQYSNLGDYSKILEGVPVQDAEGPTLEKYSSIDSDLTNRIYIIHNKMFEDEPILSNAYKNILIPVSDVLCKMEYNGIRVNPPRLHIARQTTKKIVAETLHDIMRHPTIIKYQKDKDIEFNPNSHTQLGDIFYSKKYENLEPTILTKKAKKPATSQEVFKIYKDSNGLANLFYTYSRYLTMDKTFEEIKNNLTIDHRVHTNYWISSTKSGRSSCVSTDAEILTASGWKKYNEIIIGELVLGYDILKKELKLTPLNNIHIGKGILGTLDYIYGKIRKVGTRCTPEHKWLVEDKFITGYIEAQNADKTKQGTGRTRNNSYNLILRSENPASFGDDNDYIRAGIIGWALTDGDINSTSKDRYSLEITLVKEQSIAAVRKLLTEGHIPFTESSYSYKHKERGDKKTSFKFKNIKRIRFYIGVATFSSIWLHYLTYQNLTSYVIALSYKARQYMWDAMMEADGATKQLGGHSKYYRFGSAKSSSIFKSENCGDGFAALSVLLGHFVHYRQRQRSKNQKPFIDYEIATVIKRHAKRYSIINNEQQDVWCPETGTGNWIIKQDGFIGITGNSRDPNLQKLPKGEKDLTGLRAAFIADPDHYLVEMDFGLHELRCMAEQANDDIMRAALAKDIHKVTTADILRIPLDQVTDDQRTRIGKKINFSIIYLKSAWGLARDLKISEKEAQNYLNSFFLTYRQTKKYIDDTIQFVKEHGYILLRSGFKKYYPAEEGLTDHEIRSAFNATIQGLAGHILFMALIEIDKFLVENNLKSFLTLEVHDSVVINLHKTELNIIPDLVNVMINAVYKYIPDWKTPLVADVKIGLDWGHMQKYEVK